MEWLSSTPLTISWCGVRGSKSIITFEWLGKETMCKGQTWRRGRWGCDTGEEGWRLKDRLAGGFLARIWARHTPPLFGFKGVAWTKGCFLGLRNVGAHRAKDTSKWRFDLAGEGANLKGRRGRALSCTLPPVTCNWLKVATGTTFEQLEKKVHENFNTRKQKLVTTRVIHCSKHDWYERKTLKP